MFHPFTGHEGPQGEQRYSSTLFQTSALEGGEGSASRPGRTLPPGKTRYPLYRRLGGPQGRSGLVRKISTPPGLDPRTVQSVGSSYTNFASRPTTVISPFFKSANPRIHFTVTPVSAMNECLELMPNKLTYKLHKIMSSLKMVKKLRSKHVEAIFIQQKHSAKIFVLNISVNDILQKNFI